MTKATPIVNKLPVATVESDRIIKGHVPETSPYEKEIMGLMRGAMIIAPITTAALLASKPSVAITAEIDSMK